MNKDEYQYILSKLSLSMFPTGFCCMYSKTNICICFTKAYFDFLIEHLMKIVKDTNLDVEFVGCQKTKCPKKEICKEQKECGNCDGKQKIYCLREPYLSVESKASVDKKLTQACPNSIYSTLRFQDLDHIITILRDIESECHHDERLKRSVVLLLINFLNDGQIEIQGKNKDRLSDFKVAINQLNKDLILQKPFKKALCNLLNDENEKLSLNRHTIDLEDLSYGVFLKIINVWLNEKSDESSTKENTFDFFLRRTTK